MGDEGGGGGRTFQPARSVLVDRGGSRLRGGEVDLDTLGLAFPLALGDSSRLFRGDSRRHRFRDSVWTSARGRARNNFVSCTLTTSLETPTSLARDAQEGTKTTCVCSTSPQSLTELNFSPTRSPTRVDHRRARRLGLGHAPHQTPPHRPRANKLHGTHFWPERLWPERGRRGGEGRRGFECCQRSRCV